MSRAAVLQRCVRALGGFWPPVAVWLLGIAALAGVGVESLFVEPAATFVYARLTGYITALMLAAVMFGMVVVFALSCGVMLWWLDGAPSAGNVVRAVYRSLWLFAGYVWVGVTLLLVEPPAALNVADMASVDEFQADMEALPALRWIERLRYVVAGAFLALVAWFLSRTSKPVNAVLAVAFGAAALAGLMALLGLMDEGV